MNIIKTFKSLVQVECPLVDVLLYAAVAVDEPGSRLDDLGSLLEIGASVLPLLGHLLATAVFIATAAARSGREGTTTAVTKATLAVIVVLPLDRRTGGELIVIGDISHGILPASTAAVAVIGKAISIPTVPTAPIIPIVSIFVVVARQPRLSLHKLRLLLRGQTEGVLVVVAVEQRLQVVLGQVEHCHYLLILPSRAPADVLVVGTEDGLPVSAVLDSVVDDEAEYSHLGVVAALHIEVSTDDLGHGARTLLAVPQDTFAEGRAITAFVAEDVVLAQVG